MNFVERLRGQPGDDGEWRFDLTEELNGGFGGTNGGTLAAVCVYVARSISPSRIPAGLDIRFLRGFRPGIARIRPTVLNAGRTLTTVSVDVLTHDDKLATRATVSLAAPGGLAAIDQAPSRERPADLADYADGKTWRQPRGGVIPLIETFSPRAMGRGEDGIATGITVIWEGDTYSAEAACIAADISVGPPVAAALKGRPLAMPNPDIALRFTGRMSTTDHLVSVCRLEGISAGLATTSMVVFSGTTLLAVGASTTTCLGST